MFKLPIERSRFLMKVYSCLRDAVFPIQPRRAPPATPANEKLPRCPRGPIRSRHTAHCQRGTRTFHQTARVFRRGSTRIFLNPTIDPTKKARGSNQEPLRQEREKMQKPPQIIVIPQSMLAGQKSLLRLAPSPMNRNSSALLSTSSPSPLLSSAAISPMLSSNPRPVAAVVGSKRPAPTQSPQPKELLLDIKEENTENEAPARKRANLDHLSPEERMMRRKLKNRVAAQTARDKKKAATDSMEKQLADVQARLQESLDANAQLLKTNTQLQMENASLQQQNNELQARLSPLCTLPPSPPASPLPSPTATSPHTPLSTVLSPPETADLTCVPQQQEQGKSTMPQASSNPGLSSKDLTPWGRAPALTVVCAALLALSPKHQPPSNPSPSPSPSPPLPLKKRPTPQ